VATLFHSVKKKVEQSFYERRAGKGKVRSALDGCVLPADLFHKNRAIKLQIKQIL